MSFQIFKSQVPTISIVVLPPGVGFNDSYSFYEDLNLINSTPFGSLIFKVGDLIVFKGKGCCDEVKVAMFTGYITDVERIDDKTPGACEVMLGIFHYSLFSLFEDFERFYNGRWWPFGVIDE